MTTSALQTSRQFDDVRCAAEARLASKQVLTLRSSAGRLSASCLGSWVTDSTAATPLHHSPAAAAVRRLRHLTRLPCAKSRRPPALPRDGTQTALQQVCPEDLHASCCGSMCQFTRSGTSADAAVARRGAALTAGRLCWHTWMRASRPSGACTVCP